MNLKNCFLYKPIKKFKMIFSIICVFNIEPNAFNPLLFSKNYQKYVDFGSNQFRCPQSNKLISLKEINDGICQCCDGSDEFINITYCFNTCPTSLSKRETTKLRSIFSTAIKNRVALSSNRTTQYRIFKESIEAKRRQVDKMKNQLNKAKEAYQKSKTNLKAWVYKTNKIPLPDPKKEEEAMQEYINRIDPRQYLTKIEEDEEEDEEGVDATPKIDELELESIKEHRINKWLQKKHDAYSDLLQNALETYRATKSKLADKNPKEYSNCIKAKKQLKDIEQSYTNLLNEIQEGDKRLRLNYGPDYIWFTEKSIEVKIKDEDAVVSFEFMKHATIRFLNPSDPSLEYKEIGEFQPPVTRMMHYGPKTITDQWSDYSFSIRMVCFPEFRVFDTKAPVMSRVISTIGLPEVCNTTFSEEDFDNYLHEVAQFKKEIFENGEL
ncbi:hypothetical protein TRFO_40675 [Tritrichomonas foetus]|uniref:Glucosidase II beta subunit N-terminal domain-containing protein n=1 Tax=Tritrichomonas foetus TaxID=1144522 RepID=A0A1J4J0T1_9EUKA|nr:hypothetical protein TRFO_40675 [Tritrichomonas foetus]|eukprot:OHS93018.1 hypothetical protein TRFO_40675 [Tritrichomonas foetus]